MERKKAVMGTAVARNRTRPVITLTITTRHLRYLMWVPVLLLMAVAVVAELHGENGIFCLFAGVGACLGQSFGLLDGKR